VPIGLGNDAHLEPLRLEQSADDGHAEAGMIHVGIAGDDDDVAALPAENVHFGTAGRQKPRRLRAGGVLLEAGKQGGGGLHARD